MFKQSVNFPSPFLVKPATFVQYSVYFSNSLIPFLNVSALTLKV